MIVSSRSSPRRNGFPDVDLFLDVVLDESGQFPLRRRPLPGAGEAGGELLDPSPRHDDLARAGRTALPAREKEQQRPEEQEVDERLAEKLSHLLYSAPRLGPVQTRIICGRWSK